MKRRGRGEGTVRHLASGQWLARWSYIDGSGKRRRPSSTHDTKREAHAWLAAQIAAHSPGSATDAEGLTVGEWLDRWLASGTAAATERGQAR